MSGILEINEGCTNDIQCKSGICYQETCQSGVSIAFKTQLSSLKVGEEMAVELSLINTIDDDINAQLIILPDTGISISGSDGADICSLSQCTAFEGVLSRDGMSVELRIAALEPGTKKIGGKILYTLNGKQRESSITGKIRLYDCGDRTCDAKFGETQENCCTDCGLPESGFFSSYECQEGKSIKISLFKKILRIVGLGE